MGNCDADKAATQRRILTLIVPKISGNGFYI